jgi:hypothetical protein
LWLERWSDDEERPFDQPKLFFKQNGESNVIFDSRSSKVVEHDVGAVSKQVLLALNKPRSIEAVAKEFSQIPNFDCAQEVARLQKLGLIFQEGIQYLSLVHPKEPPTMSHR